MKSDKLILITIFLILFQVCAALAGVVSTTPGDNAVNVSTTTVISATFDDDAYANFVTGGTCVVMPLSGFDPQPVPGVRSYSARTATFTLSGSLAANMEYNVSITPDFMMGGYSWSFTTGAGGTTIPPVASTNPAANATNVPLDTHISVTFTDDSYANIATQGSFTVMPLTGFDPAVTGVISYSNRIATFTPSAPLLIDVEYLVSITPDNIQPGYSWNFTTGTGGSSTACRIPLHKGWNLVSFPVNKCYYLNTAGQPTVSMIAGIEFESVSSIDTILSSISGNYSYVQGFDSTGAKTYNLTPFSNMKYMAAGYGYWIKIDDGIDGLIYLELEGSQAPAGSDIQLQSGWNLVGHLGKGVKYVGTEPGVHFPTDRVMVPISGVDAIFSPINGNYSYVQGFDETGAKTYNLTPFSNMKYTGPGYGYWIKVNDAASPAMSWE